MAKKKKKVIAGVLVALVVAGGGYAVLMTVRGMNQNISAMAGGYSVIAAGENDLSKTISATGSVIGNGTVDVTSKLTAEIAEVKVSLGDHVKKGDELCVFDKTELQEQYDELKEQLDKADKQTESSHTKNERDLKAAKSKKTTAVKRAQRVLDKAITDRDKAYKEYNDLVDEYNSHLNDQPSEDGMEYDFEAVNIELETMYAGLSAYDEAVTAAQDAYDDTVESCNDAIQAIQDIIDAEEFEIGGDAQKQLDELAEQLEQCTVIAPQDGVITALNVNEGTIPSAPSLMTIVNTDKTVIELTVKETDITQISEGMAAVVTSKVLPDEEFSAKISRIVNVLSADENAIYSDSDSSGYKVEVTLDDTNEKLLIGMSASVEITLDDIGEKLSVPYSGIVDKDGKSVVYVAVPDGDESGMYTVRKTEVTVGAESDFYTEIVSGDIKEGDLIIENPQGDDILDPVEDGGRIVVNE